MKTQRSFLLFLIGSFAVLCAARAQSFVRLGVGQEPVEGGHYVLLSSLPGSAVAISDVAKRDKLGSASVTLRGDTVVVGKRAAVWTIKRVAGGVAWCCEGGYLTTEARTTSLALGDRAFAWQMSMMADTLWLAHNDNGRKRVVGFNSMTGSFGCYLDSGADEYGALLVYRAASECAADTSAGQPDKIDTAVSYGLIASHGEGFVAASARTPDNAAYLWGRDVAGCRATDSAWVVTQQDLNWHVRPRQDGGFDLLDYAGYCLLPGEATGQSTYGFKLRRESGNEASWSLRSGRLSAIDGQGRVFYMVYQPAGEGRFVLTEQPTPQQLPVSLTPLTAEGSQTVAEGGVLRLRGHFAAATLCAAMTGDVLSLDLTRTVLPRQALPFDDETQGNALIYVSLSAVPHVPAAWRNVVAVDTLTGTAHALRPIRLKDGRDFAPAFAFTVGPDSLSYTRLFAADDQWSTLYLPFVPAAWPNALQPYRVVAVTNDHLQLEPVAMPAAHMPLLLKPGAALTAGDTLRFTAAPQRIEPMPQPAGTMRGTLTRRDVTAAGEACYLLADDGTRFVQAASGSYAAPFRCYLTTTRAAHAVTLDINTTGISTTKTHTAPATIYSLDGTKLPATPHRGLYIENHKLHKAR